jgi:hypothetical protein
LRQLRPFQSIKLQWSFDMSWEDMMRRIFPPTAGFSPHVTSHFGERFNRPAGSSNPHGGVDFNYNVGPGGQRGINLQNPALRSSVDGVVENAGGGTVVRVLRRVPAMKPDKPFANYGQDASGDLLSAREGNFQ